jgi:predicted esterase
LKDDAGIEQAKTYVHGLINEEIAAGIPCHRIALGGFSMGGALALYVFELIPHKLITSKYQHYLRPDLPMMGHLAASYQ